MIRKSILVLALFALAGSIGCAGVRQTNSNFSAHAESFRILGYPIPSDDMAAAAALVPVGGTVTTVRSTPADWDSVFGFIGNLFGFNLTRISGTK